MFTGQSWPPVALNTAEHKNTNVQMCSKDVQKKEWMMDREYRVQEDKWAIIYRLSVASYMNIHEFINLIY